MSVALLYQWNINVVEVRFFVGELFGPEPRVLDDYPNEPKNSADYKDSDHYDVADLETDPQILEVVVRK